MAKPVILTLDDEVQVLNAIDRDLRAHYGKDYRVVKATSPTLALETLEQLKTRNEQVALLLVDQRMPEMEGTEFLAQALKLYPEARKVLLTAYADTRAAITAINDIGLDHYLMKPWSPPEQNLYPVLDDVLDDWQATVPVPYDGIRVAGTLWSATSHRVKDFLARSQIPYQWLDIERDAETRTLVESLNEGQGRLPVVFFPDGSTLIEPDLSALADKVGLQTRPSQPFYDVIIVGAGPAGLAAAVYGASEGLRTLLIDKETTGGQAGTSSRIENYLGFPKGLSGADLARRATSQATRLGAEILTAQEVTAIRADGPYRFVTLSDGTELSSHAVIIASGVSVRMLEVPGIEGLTGAGVYYGAAISEAAHYAGEHVFVVGGANSAGQAAMFFSRYAAQVTMLVRGDSLAKGMSQYLVDQIESTGNIEVRLGASVAEVHGTDRLEGLTIKSKGTDEVEPVPAAALFIFIGAKPHTGFVPDDIERNDAGFILTGPDLVVDGRRPKGWPLQRDPYLLETNVPGILAVGDVRQGVVRRVAAAVGQGSTAISFVHQYLRTV
ncbi:MAG: FAD-dependent oxidoreductase [Myxococcales bacterium]|nr:MAG: FAD-dependent oxidoreductase [Myxococcales bacterium]